MTKRIYQRAGTGVMLALGLLVHNGASAADAEEELRERQMIVGEVTKRMADEKLYAEAMAAGKERTILCAQCHGEDGNAKKPEYPNLAEQNPTYIAQQMAKFKDGRRKSFVMEALVRSFTMEDKINLAVYFTSEKLKPIAEADPAIAARGEKKYKEVCFRCHGENGRGEKGYARLAGQQIGYVMMNLKRYRANARKATDFDERRRTDANMEQVTQFLTDAEIEGLAHYIALMK